MRLITGKSFIAFLIAGFIAAYIATSTKTGSVLAPTPYLFLELLGWLTGLVAVSGIFAMIVSGLYHLVSKKPVRKVFTAVFWIVGGVIAIGILLLHLSTFSVTPKQSNSTEYSIKLISEHAYLPYISMVAFYCSALASKADKTPEQSRLFEHGYQTGERLLTALNNGKFSKEDRPYSAIVTILEEASQDNIPFVLGSFSEKVAGKVNDDVESEIKKRKEKWKTDQVEHPLIAELLKPEFDESKVASKMFSDKFCVAIGR